VRLGQDRWLAETPPDRQARYPLAALTSAPGWVDVLWTTDRTSVSVTQLRPWEAPSSGPPAPPPCEAPERLTRLDLALETERTAWLVCLTDRSRVLLAGWDLSVGSHGHWQTLNPPGDGLASITVTSLSGTPVIIALTVSGNLLGASVRDALAGRGGWHSIDRPAELRGPSAARIISAAGTGTAGWLAAAGHDAAWLIPLERDGSVVRCGPAAPVWLGG
jgi:hypothetical protein